MTRSQKKRLIILSIGIVLVFGGLIVANLVKAHMIKEYFAHAKAPAVTISTSPVVTKTWHPSLHSIGSLVAINGVNITPEFAGLVTAIHFKSGQWVNKDQALVQLDKTIDTQTLKNNLANYKLDQINYDRAVLLFKKKVMSAEKFDKAAAKLKMSQAAVDKAKIMIDKKTIRAPFAGKIGIRTVNLGQYVSPGTALVNLQSLDPLYVNFSVPEQDLSKVHLNQKITLHSDSYPHKTFHGHITALNAEVSTKTRNLQIQATLKNPKHLLYPGLFATVLIHLGKKQHVLSVPQTAIAYSLYGDSVYVVTPDPKQKTKGVAHQRFVKLGATHHGHIAITEGVKAGELVVNAGQMKLHDGTAVVINNTVKLTDSIHHDQTY